MGKVISVINMKGGVGKTTLAVNLAYTLSTVFGKRVLIIDIDPQMNATQYTFNMNECMVEQILNDENKTIYGILDDKLEKPSIMQKTKIEKKAQSFEGIFQITEKFHVIPSHLNIMMLPLYEHYNRLNRFIQSNLKGNYDAIILDSPPTISPYTKISLIASDAYIVPMKTDYLSLFGLPLLQSYIGSLKDEFNQDLEFLGIVLTMVNPELKIYHDVKKKLSERPEWKSKVFHNELKQKTKISRALSPELENTLPYIIELKDEELRNKMISITEEFATKARLL